MKTRSFVDGIRQVLSPLTDLEKAAQMRAYMKDRYVYIGIPTPQRRATCMPLIKECKDWDRKQLLEAAGILWALPEREYQYAAIDLLARHHRTLVADDIESLLALVQSKSWWDSVDGLAGIIGDVLHRHLDSKRSIQLTMDDALKHPDFWVRRVALIHQLGWRDDTDVQRLFRYTESLAHEKEFFIRKAIGWALRDYAWHDPDCIREYLQRMQSSLSPLSYREAGKNLGRA